MARASKASAAKKSASKKSTTKKAVKKSETTKATTKKTPAAKAASSRSTASKATSSKATSSKASSSKASSSKATSSKASSSKATSKSGAGGRGKKAKSPFDSRFLEQMRKLLNSERETYQRQAVALKAEADSLVADLDPGDVQFDEESGEGDTIAVERGRDLALAAKALEMIEEIDHALSKFEIGTYGVCEISGEPIPKERLEAIPWAREKVEFKVGGFGRR